ncbi:uncharacterized protein LOC113273219 [Papaver somniferum]|uniref:uncharacterized protein LOC113273219 n=1 Tax=Papaver somniferum TaxID=3469 RepID=UPI000E6F91B0|nr:uncharacterized protein LOC113273219 [Papaver somniferum]
MFATMTKDLMLTILKKGKTGKEIGDHLKTLFQDNKGSRAANLEYKFVNLKFSDCASVDDYCDKLKSLSDRLSDLDFPMNDKRLVIQLVNVLTEEYNTVASFIQQSMPTFDAARSQLRTEEIRGPQHSLASAPTALAAAAPSDRNSLRLHQPNNGRRIHRQQQSDKRPQHAHHTGSGPTAATSSSPPLLPTPPGPRPYLQPDYQQYWPPYWAIPPCPYPTAPSWHRPPAVNQRHASSRGRSSGRNHGQSYITPSTELLQPTDIAEAYSSMHLQPPDDAFYRILVLPRTLLLIQVLYIKFSIPSMYGLILVDNGNGNDNSIPVTASGIKFITLSSRTLQLKNTLVVPDIIKNLVSVRKFTTENHVSVEFDPAGFYVKDLSSRKIILRCNSSEELYPITNSAVPPQTPSQSSPISLTVFSPDIWHNRLGHPGKAILDVLCTNNSIHCNKDQHSKLFHS